MAIQFNLLPWREQLRAKRAKRSKVSMGLAFVVGLCLSGAYYGYEQIRLDDHNKAFELVSNANKKLEAQLKEKKELDALKIKLKNQIASIDALQADRASVAHMVEELSNANTQELFLIEFSLKDGFVEIVGIAENDSQISDLMKRLRASEWYQDPTLIEIVSEHDLGEEVKRFKITSKLLLPGAETVATKRGK